MSVAACPGVQTPSIVVRNAEPRHRAPRPVQAAETRMIYIVGANAGLMEWAALSLFRAGHVPVLGQWFSPLLTSDAEPAPQQFDENGDPVADRLIGRCDAVLRVDGPAPGADALVSAARARGLRVFMNLDDAIAG
jgi:hypothetical protein